MIQERRPLPESIGGLLNIAVSTYFYRFRLYFGVAVAGLVAEAILTYLRPADIGMFYAGTIVVDSFVSALVTVGMVADMQQTERLPDRSVAGNALGRWGIVAIVTTLVDIVTFYTSGAVFGPPEDTAYGFLILPIIVAWGSLAFATVIAAVDVKTPPHILVFSALGRSVSLALARQNVGRLIALALVAALPALVETVLADQLALRKVADWQFIANVPIDVLVSGPLQAMFTIFYLDFVRRSSTPRGS